MRQPEHKGKVYKVNLVSIVVKLSPRMLLITKSLWYKNIIELVK